MQSLELVFPREIKQASLPNSAEGRQPGQDTKHGVENVFLSGIRNQEPQKPREIRASQISLNYLKEHWVSLSAQRIQIYLNLKDK